MTTYGDGPKDFFNAIFLAAVSILIVYPVFHARFADGLNVKIVLSLLYDFVPETFGCIENAALVELISIGVLNCTVISLYTGIGFIPEWDTVMIFGWMVSAAVIIFIN